MFKGAKVLKRIIIIFLSLILVIFIALLAAPFLFKDQLMELAKTELNKLVLAKIDFKDLKLSFIRNFPNAYVALEELEVTGTGDFDGELLAAFDILSVTVDIISVIKMENIEVKSILLNNARFNGRIPVDGKANWEIIKPSEANNDVIEKETEDSSPFKFKAGLNRFEIRNMQITFRDEAHKMLAEIKEINLVLKGNMKLENVDLNLDLGIKGIDFWLDGIRFANKANVGFISEIAADLKNLNFILRNNRFNLNDIVLKLAGSLGIHESDINMDITFASEKTDFKSLLSLVPAIYMNSFRDLKTTGRLALSGDVKGTLNEKTMPNANINLSVDNASFSYPGLPKSVDKINIAARIFYNGTVFDRTTVDVDRFNFEIAGNPFNAEVHIKTPESDMQVSAMFSGIIDIDSITDIIPVNDFTLNGMLECDVTVEGKLSMLEKAQYEDFQAQGHLILSGFDFESPEFAKAVTIKNMQLNLTPRFVELAVFDAVIGNSDIAMNGTLENFIPFVLRKETIKGTLALRSNTIDLNEIMSGIPTKEETAARDDTTQLSVIEVPKNIDFAMTVNIARIFFDKLLITNTAGALTLKDGTVVMRNLAMNLLEGSMTLNGEYNTQNMDSVFVDFNMDIRQFDITSALLSFAVLERMLPNPRNYAGRVSAAMTFRSVFDEHLSPVLNTINSRGRLQTQSLQLRNNKLFGTIADLIKNENWRNPALGNVNIGYEIKDGRLWINDPIVMNIQPARVELKGSQGLDRTMDYRVDASVPISIIGSEATGILNRIPGGSRINEIRITGQITGDVRDPDISLTMTDMAGSIVGAIREQVTEAVTQVVERVTQAVEDVVHRVEERVEEVRTQAINEINQRIDQVMSEAQRQADNIRNTAKQAADRLRSEANAAADKLISEAASISNPIARIAAQRLAQEAADTARREGETRAGQLEREAETQAQTVLNTAQRTADDIRRGIQ